MHLTRSLIAVNLVLLTALPAPGQQAAPAQGTQTPVQQAPAAQAPASQPPSAPAAPTAPAQPRASRQPAQIGLPTPTRIAEIPRGQVVLIAGVVSSAQPTTFVLNDGNASIVVHLGATWQELTRARNGDRIRVLGQMDPYGTPVFRAGSIVLDNGRIIVVPNS